MIEPGQIFKVNPDSTVYAYGTADGKSFSKTLIYLKSENFFTIFDCSDLSQTKSLDSFIIVMTETGQTVKILTRALMVHCVLIS